VNKKNTISDIANELESLAVDSPALGLGNNGLTGISLFFSYYALFTGDERYMELANNSLEKIVTDALNHLSYYSAPEFANIGKTVEFLFLEVDADEFAGFFEETLMCRLRADVGIVFGFCMGITGICDFFLNKTNNQEALDITFGHIYSGLKVKGYPKHPIESLFLFPSEVLRDIKIFFLKLEKMNITIPQKRLLEQAIQKFESKKILQSNCYEYKLCTDIIF